MNSDKDLIEMGFGEYIPSDTTYILKIQALVGCPHEWSYLLPLWDGPRRARRCLRCKTLYRKKLTPAPDCSTLWGALMAADKLPDGYWSACGRRAASTIICQQGATSGLRRHHRKDAEYFTIIAELPDKPSREVHGHVQPTTEPRGLDK